jgi:hypothetical protein
VSDAALLNLARAILVRSKPKSWDSAWDTRGTSPEIVSQGFVNAGTAKSTEIQSDDASVPLSQPLGRGTVGQYENLGIVPGTLVGQYYSAVFDVLRSKCPDLVEIERWQLAVRDAQFFLSTWGQQAHALGWTNAELFGLHPISDRPPARYNRLSRYDCTGLIWLLQGRPVVALTAETAAIQTASGGILTYPKNNKPAFGPVGDSLDDFGRAV